ncbi:MAG: MBL fold metallo-hydrolase [Bacteroidota bacterium]|jgi:L-ascorbate metabolism protein UlaG (beta-lactamase superfamily)
MNTITLISLAALAAAVQTADARKIEKDVFKTPSGELSIYFVGHGSLMFEFSGKTVHVDPWSRLADYGSLPKADLILITHHHPDHLDSGAIAAVSKDGTHIILTGAAYELLKKGTVMKNGDTLTVEGIKIEAVPAYNTTAGRDQFHPKGRDNGYIITIAGKRIYIAGDTENIPEMAEIRNIDIAFLPMNQPYTMLPEQVADAAKMIHPRILYPYHYGDTDAAKLQKLLSGNKDVEVRIRQLR